MMSIPRCPETLPPPGSTGQGHHPQVTHSARTPTRRSTLCGTPFLELFPGHRHRMYSSRKAGYLWQPLPCSSRPLHRNPSTEAQRNSTISRRRPPTPHPKDSIPSPLSKSHALLITKTPRLQQPSKRRCPRSPSSSIPSPVLSATAVG